MATEYEPTIFDYLLIMRRRAPYLIGIFFSVLLISVIYSIVIPPTYRATGTIMVETQQVSANILPSAIKNQLNDQINFIIQRIMTRESLMGIANKYSLFKGDMSSLTTSEIVEKMRDRIVIEKGDGDISMNSFRQGPQAISFTLSFEDRNPEVALQATNDLIAIFLDLSDKLRIEGATETTDFLVKQSSKLKVTVDGLEKKIAEYKHEHSNALPEQLTLRMSMLDRAQNNLLEVERDYRSTKEDIRSLEVELAAARNGTDEANQPQTLPSLKAEYARLSAVYKESYPDLRELKRKIAAMEKPAETPVSGITSIDDGNPSLAAYRLQAKIASDNARLSSLAQQREILQRKITENESAMIQTPSVEQNLAILIRDRDTAQKKYEEIRNNLMNAQIAQNLVSDDKAAHFSVLEPPVLPEKPFKPKRMKILALGFFLALVSSVGGVMGLESINKRIRGTEELTHVLGYRPLVVIPYLPVQEEEEHRKHMIKVAIRAAVAVLIVAILAISFLYFGH
jgi:succinoglycan biosynthesis transport protein ExoP